MKRRVSFIEFLNSVPLGWGFTHGSFKGRFEVLKDVPSQCAQRLQEGSADVGLIPVIEYQRIPGLKILPNLSIASKREVKSVLFVSKGPVEEVSSIALDSASRTSVALLRILLERFRGLGPIRYLTLAPDPHSMLQNADAALIIGNPALQIRRSDYEVLDLAHEWHTATGLPFVFAVWAVRANVQLGEDLAVFYESLQEGNRHINQIAESYSRVLGLSPQAIKDYIQRNLNYSLDSSNLAGLERFFKEAWDLGLIEHPRQLDFYESDD